MDEPLAEPQHVQFVVLSSCRDHPELSSCVTQSYPRLITQGVEKVKRFPVCAKARGGSIKF